MTYRDGSETNSVIAPGVLTKYAEDLYPVVKALLGNNADKLKLDEPVNINNIKVYYIIDPKDILCSPITEDLRYIHLRAVEYLADLCTEKPKEVSFDGLRNSVKLWKFCMSKEPNKNLQADIVNRQGEINVGAEIVKHFTIGGDYTLGTIFCLITGLFPIADEKWAVAQIDSLRNDLLSILDDNSVLLYPSSPLPARHHYSSYFRPMNFSFFAIWNVLKFPVTQVPMGLGVEGVPIGIQVVAAPYQDRLSLAIAKELERQFGGWVPPFQTKSKIGQSRSQRLQK